MDNKFKDDEVKDDKLKDNESNDNELKNHNELAAINVRILMAIGGCFVGVILMRMYYIF